jgi:hypothetical protein
MAKIGGGGGVTDHGGLTGLADDDHTQYHTDARGDARYHPQSAFVSTSAGAGDAGKPVKLNGSGLVDATMLPAASIPDPYTPPDGTWNVVGAISAKGSGAPATSEAFGVGATVGSVASALAVGASASVSAANGIALGASASVAVANGIAIGAGASLSAAATLGVAIGNDLDISGANSVGIGCADITDSQVVCVGVNASSRGASVAIGYFATASPAAGSCVAIGSNAVVGATEGVAVGRSASVNGAGSIAIGYSATAGTFTNSVALGANAVCDANNQMRLGTAAQVLNIFTDGVARVSGGLILRGYTSTTADPTTTEIPTDKQIGVHKNTTSGIVYLAFNDGGAIKKVALS